MLVSLPEFLTCYGWSIRPTTLEAWYAALDALSVEVTPPLDDVGGTLHFFTDGSCLNQAYPSCRLAAWAVVYAGTDLPGGSQVVASGALPGLLQSAYRSEIFAIFRALQIGRLQTGPVHLWTDCAAVQKRFNKLLVRGEVRPIPPMLICGLPLLSVSLIFSQVKW